MALPEASWPLLADVTRCCIIPKDWFGKQECQLLQLQGLLPWG